MSLNKNSFVLDDPALNIFSFQGLVFRTFLTCPQASSEHSVCFAVPEKEAEQVRRALERKFRRDLDAGRLSKVQVSFNVIDYMFAETGILLGVFICN